MINLPKKFTGKKLLLLGTNRGTCDMVDYAKSQGAYVIVTDNLLPEKSPAKLIADEAWPISSADVDALEKMITKNRVNGISAGASEFNLERALTLCERIGLPFYCNRKQWEICSSKQLFKQLCHDNGVPVAKEYTLNSDFREEDLRQIRYPVIVKPVDSSAGIGIRICRNEAELVGAYAKAASQSLKKRALVEEYITGDEFNAGYNIREGQFSLSCMGDRYFYPEQSATIPLPQLSIWPSKYIERYISELNDKVIRMFKSIEVSNGFIFVQGLINEKGFHLFESNYRLPGSPWYRFISQINGINHMEMLVDFALTGKMEGFDLSLDKPKFRKYFCNFNCVSKGGTVGKIIGLEEVRRKKGIIFVDNYYEAGDYIEKSGTLKQLHLKFYILEDTVQELKNSIKEIQAIVKVLDDKGNDMLLPPFNTDKITN